MVFFTLKGGRLLRPSFHTLFLSAPEYDEPNVLRGVHLFLSGAQTMKDVPNLLKSTPATSWRRFQL